MIVHIEKLIYGGDGLALDGGKPIFVPFAAAGDELEIEITEDHGDYARARIVRVVHPSPDRRLAPCLVFGECGGCQWQHIAYESQLVWKRRILIEAFARIAKLDPDEIERCILPTLPSRHEWHYRNRIQLHVGGRGRVGFYKPRSREVVEFDECLIADGRLNDELHAHRGEFAQRDRGVALRVDGDDSGDFPSFVQINTEQNARLQRLVCEWVAALPHAAILELYAGGGNFTFPLAEHAKRITAIDIDRRAIDFAKKLQRDRGVAHVTFVQGDASAMEGLEPETYNLILLDPPRKGAAESLDEIARLSPRGIIYISCNPATLARDVKHLISKGFLLERSQPVDMFPQTFHVESVTLLTPAERS